MLGVRPLLEQLERVYGPQRWWPAESPFEVIIGALLVQRTTWANADAAIANLRHHGLLRCVALAGMDPSALAQLIRSAGFYRTKATRLRALARYFRDVGGVEGLAGLGAAELRRALLSLPGIGEESADAIALYAYERPVWVSDAYSRRLFARLAGRTVGLAEERQYVEPLVIGGETRALQELHALVIEHGKQRCKAVAQCAGCALNKQCATGAQVGEVDRKKRGAHA